MKKISWLTGSVFPDVFKALDTLNMVLLGDLSELPFFFVKSLLDQGFPTGPIFRSNFLAGTSGSRRVESTGLSEEQRRWWFKYNQGCSNENNASIPSSQVHAGVLSMGSTLSAAAHFVAAALTDISNGSTPSDNSLRASSGTQNSATAATTADAAATPTNSPSPSAGACAPKNASTTSSATRDTLTEPADTSPGPHVNDASAGDPADTPADGSAGASADVPLPPKKKKRLEMGPGEQKLMRQAAAERVEQLSANINKLLEEQEELFVKYAKLNNIKVERLKKLAYQLPSMKHQKKASNYNVLLYFKGKELNDGQPKGLRKPIKDLHQEVKDNKDLQDILQDPEAMQDLRQKYKKAKAEEKVAAIRWRRSTSFSMNLTLYESSDANSFGMIVRGSYKSTVVSGYYGLGLRKLYHSKMTEEVTGVANLKMSYASFSKKIVVPFKVNIMGWPDNVPRQEALQCLEDWGAHWFCMTSAEAKSYEANAWKNGELEPMVRKKRSDAGLARKRDDDDDDDNSNNDEDPPSRKWSKRKRTAVVDDDDDDEEDVQGNGRLQKKLKKTLGGRKLSGATKKSSTGGKKSSGGGGGQKSGKGATVGKKLSGDSGGKKSGDGAGGGKKLVAQGSKKSAVNVCLEAELLCVHLPIAT
ncbi:hypothetical protein BT96DRAFT_943804 [Gymnopus androsaceus JB14]|uniref:Uncharacterized protein n=1 Tax=Gymnopus androsaceus JB14 TaxID=1447944 RepID=A0A6A4H5R7_9AGAR|nr:hypothetical protein BT96DRAFT_943804 [Gymnopus androsaceus JB14]